MSAFRLAALLPLFLWWSMMSAADARSVTAMSFAAIPGWAQDAHAAAFATFHRSCREVVATGRGFAGSPQFTGKRAEWLPVCNSALTMPEEVSDTQARAFFEKSLRPLNVSSGPDAGLFTGYYEPEVEGALKRGGEYVVPLYGKPSDLVAFDAATEKRIGVRYGRTVAGRPQPYWTRQEIEQGKLAGRGLELVWLKRWEDAFFLQIQGSGRVRLADGRILRVGFAGKSGLPYTPIGRILVERGELARDKVSMQTILDWLARHPGQARALMWKNESFVFFRRIELDRADLGPPGAQHVQLTPERSLAVDRRFYAYGTPIWLSSAVPAGPNDSLVPMNRLMVAQDTGTAIKGQVRGDVFWGAGARAGHIAGLMQSEGRMIILVPPSVASRLAN
ncbi:membrane-bound lytic murein transglycosylase A [Rhodoligotrophos appendicifer]|uniref:murein transglycosylase A n=1 Tax=Rhodoligotrophos appendicifer TaxID=987056 RepID=UPI00117D96E3|nr:MltA domain-containing protein [Rhodoligotrophos appendicifer]